MEYKCNVKSTGDRRFTDRDLPVQGNAGGVGHEVITAENGEDGIAMATREQPDVVLMDIVMPGMNGFQATRQISRDAATKHIPVIIVSSKDQETDKVWGARQGAKGYVTKPVDTRELVVVMGSLM